MQLLTERERERVVNGFTLMIAQLTMTESISWESRTAYSNVKHVGNTNNNINNNALRICYDAMSNLDICKR